MKSIVKLSALAVIALLFASCEEDVTPTLSIDGGKVKGVEVNNSVVYKGIPYAAAPVGDLRWKNPQNVQPWEGVLVADHFGPAAIQNLHSPEDNWYGKEFYAAGTEMSEDCLYLNVYTPKGASAHPEKRLPVAVWIHGGAFTGGWSHEIEFDGEAWNQRDVILVTINYRLNLYGFLGHPLLSEENENGISGNYGICDQIKALEWVNRNISKFGGDPKNVTVFGQSAGAMSVKYLVSSPASKDYIAKAIIQSGGGIRGGFGAQVPDQETLDAPGEDMFNLAEMYTLAEMRNASVEQLHEVMANYEAVQKRQLATRPHLDGVVLTEEFNDAVLNNTVADIPYMIGCVADDMGGLNGGFQEFANLRDSLSEKPAYIYFFDAAAPDGGTPSRLTGSFHSAELWYVFHTLQHCWRPYTEADYALSDKIIDYWTNFAKYGNPNGKEGDAWKPSTRENPYVQVLSREE